MNRIEREKQTVHKMIGLYCRHHLKQDTMPGEYRLLAEYACLRLDHCKYGEQKTSCKNCPTHCYAPKEREEIREVMRWVGPRMIWYSPKDAIVHIFPKLKHWLHRCLSELVSLFCCAVSPFILCPSPRCCCLSVLQQRVFYGLSFSDWLRPVSIEVSRFWVLRVTSD